MMMFSKYVVDAKVDVFVVRFRAFSEQAATGERSKGQDQGQ